VERSKRQPRGLLETKYETDTLNGIVSKYKIVLIDCSAFRSLQDGDLADGIQGFGAQNPEQWILRSQLLEKDWRFIRAVANLMEAGEKGRGEVLLTKGVLEECMNGIINPGGQISRNNGAYGSYGSSDKFLHLIGRYNADLEFLMKQKINFFEMVSGEKFTLEMDEYSQARYSEFERRYASRFRRRGLGRVDVNLLLSGASVAYERESVALLSNDFPILKSWNILSKGERTNPDDFGFYYRSDYDTFVKGRINL
jgi:hypothetical protein